MGDQYPRILTTPDSALRMPHDVKVVDSRALEAIDLASLAGLELDPWQCLVLEQMLAVREETYWDEINGREENRWAAFEFGLVVARQNGKGSILEARELAGLFLFGEKTIIHSAHLFDTSHKHFERIAHLIEHTPELAAEVMSISRSHGKEGIFLRNGQELLFKARSKGGARGFSCDLLVFDEAMMNLDSPVVEAALPTVSSRPNAQVLYTGSAGTEESEHFGRARNRALKVLSGEKVETRFGFMEWSAELCDDDCLPDCTEHDDPDDPKTWAKANPAMGFRPGLTEEYIRETEKPAMSPTGFAKERLSVGPWPAEGGGWRVIPETPWKSAKNEGSELVGKFCLAIDSAPEAAWSCISAVGGNSDEMVHVEITGIEGAAIDYRPGIKWVIPRVEAIWKAARPAFVVLDPASPAGALKEELESKGIKVETLTSREFAQACGDFKTAVAPKQGDGKPTLVHLDQVPLNTAVAGADKKPVVDLWIWSRAESVGDVTPLRCVTLGYWGYKQHIFQKKSKPWGFYA
ncbi:hypothetical protein [Nocardia grenadensis]|uniref:hypothetical protein n=1 Tax=Nocardia grenadensis TaxID=931537 RepID=UPI000AE305D2|nr:hypothetical protein [Nocardia grenadensis]